MTYELEAKEILRGLLRHPSGEAEVLELCESFVERYGRRPTALEALHEGHDPRSVRKTAGSWLGFLESREYLTGEESAVLAGHGEFLKRLEGTPMTRSYKMLTLLAMLARDAFPGAIEIDDGVRRRGGASVEMTREIVDWRLGEYMQRSSVAGEEPVSFVCDVGYDGRQRVLDPEQIARIACSPRTPPRRQQPPHP